MKKYCNLLFIIIPLLFFGCQPSPENNSDSKKTTAPDNQKSAKKIIFFGNSLTAGYGVEPSQAFPALIQKKIDSLGLDYKVVNAGLSGETTASGKNRVEWVLDQGVDIFVLELGGNDGLRGIDTEETRKNLQEIINIVSKEYPDAEIILAGMQIPPNMGADRTKKFRQIYKYLAEENNLTLIPFLLEGVGGEPSLNLPDGIHPNVEGHKIVAENVWSVLEGLLINQQATAP